MAGRKTNSGKNLKCEWSIPARQVRYSKDGNWYMPLEEFPGALADVNGYILFATRRAYESCKELGIRSTVSVPGGISTIPGYFRKIGLKEKTNKAAIDVRRNYHARVEGRLAKPSWSKWVSVAAWLDGTVDAGLKPQDGDCGVYRFRVRKAHPLHSGMHLYLGSTHTKPGRVLRGVDHFTGLRLRIGYFISAASGFGMKDNPGCRIGDYGLSARDLEVSWAVVDCPMCVEHEEYKKYPEATRKRLLNRRTPHRCKSAECPRRATDIDEY